MIITDEAFQQFIREYQQKQLARFGGAASAPITHAGKEHRRSEAPYVIQDSRDYITCGHCRCVNGVGMVCAQCGRVS